MIDSRFYAQAGPFSLGDLLSDLNVQELLQEKFADEMISLPAKLSEAELGSISFLVNAKNKASLENSKATACFVPEKFAPLVSAQSIIPIITPTPRAHFARIMSLLVKIKPNDCNGAAPEIAPSAKVHSSAVLAAGVKVSDHAIVGPFCVLGPGVSIGSGTVLESHVSVICAEIGNDCLIKSGAHIGGEGFGMDGDETGIINLPHIGRTMIGDRVRIGSQSCVDRGFLGDTVISDDVKIDNLVQVAHNCTIGEGTMLAGHVGISGSCSIGKNVKMGGAVGIADHLAIGDGVQIAASSGVMNNIPAGEIWGGTPALPIREQARILFATRKLIEKKKT